MAHSSTLVVVGASLAGAKAAVAAREVGYDGRIVLVGDEAHLPYERPPLSKAFLRGVVDLDSAYVYPAARYADHNIELVSDHVNAIDPHSRRVRLATGDDIGFDTLVLATGSEPRRLNTAGSELRGIEYLRTVDDALRLRDAINTATRVAVVGAGWIGSEVAASARQMGIDVVLIGTAPVPLHRVLGDEVGDMFASLHADHGVALRMNSRVTELRGDTSVEEVVLDDGHNEAADLVVVGIGVTPRVELAAHAGLRVENGVVTDEHLATDGAGIFAAGDVANAWHPHYGRHLRVEHWANALNQGITAGHNAAGRREAYTRLPYFFSDQYDLGLEYVGYASGEDDVVIRGDRTSREFIAFWHQGGIVNAAMNVNVWDVVDDLKAIVASGTRIDPARLADPDVALKELSRSTT